MKNLWLLLGFCLVFLTLCSPPRFGAQRVYAATCGVAVWTPQPGEILKSSTLGAELSHLETCYPSAAPVNTASPTATATGCGTFVVSGSYPYTLTQNTTVCNNQSNPGNTFVATTEGIAAVTHFWKFNTAPGGATPGPCPSSAVVPDDIANGATAVPSPVNITGTNTTAMLCGEPTVLRDSGSSIHFCNDGGASTSCSTNVHNYFTLPQSTLPSSAGAPGFSFGFVFADSQTYNQTEDLFSIDNTDNLEIYSQICSTVCTIATRAGGSQVNVTYNDKLGHLLLYTWDGTNGKTWLDCTLGLQNTNAPAAAAANGAIGTQLTSGPTDNFEGRIEYAFTVNTALTSAQVQTLCVASGLIRI